MRGAVGTLVALTIIAITLILYVSIFHPMMIDAERDATETACKQAVQTHAKLKTTSFNFYQSDIEQCRTDYVTVAYREKEKIMHTIAEQMRRCWWMWGEGELTLFKDDGKYCNICYIDRFRTDVDIGDMYTYLADKKYYDDKNYLEYFTGMKREEIESFDNINLTTEDDLAIMFYYDKIVPGVVVDLDSIRTEAITRMIVGGATGGVLGGVAGGKLGLSGGALTGSIIPGAGTAAGGTIGAVGGAFVGVVGGAMSGFMTGRYSFDEILEMIKNNDEGLYIASIRVMPFSEHTVEELGCTYSSARQN